MLCGLLKPDSGAGTCLGYDVIRETAAIKREVGYMTQRFSLWEDLTIRENLEFVARMYGMKDRKQAVAEALEQLGLDARQRPARRRALRRLEAAPRARRLHAAPARSCCCSTSRPPASIRRRGAISGRRSTRSPPAASRCWCPRTTWTRPSAATASPTSPTASCSPPARPTRCCTWCASSTWAVSGPARAARRARAEAARPAGRRARHGVRQHAARHRRGRGRARAGHRAVPRRCAASPGGAPSRASRTSSST